MFPNLQFVFTTHSPQVISTAQSSWVRILGANGVHGVGHVHGRDTNALLRDIMGVNARPDWMEKKLAKLEQLIESGEIAEASVLLEEVRQDVGSTDRSLMALEWELQDQVEYALRDVNKPIGSHRSPRCSRQETGLGSRPSVPSQPVGSIVVEDRVEFLLREGEGADDL